jgi:hypothetical protein
MTNYQGPGQFMPTNKSTEEFLKTSVLGPSVGPSQRRRNRKEGKKIEKDLRASEKE